MKYEQVTMKGDVDKHRFLLTKEGRKTLIVIGVNPSTANEQMADMTITKVMGFASRNGFDGFTMMNLYPQRCTNPNDLDVNLNEELHRQNLEVIKQVACSLKEPVVLLAFGNTIGERSYLKKCLGDIVSILTVSNPQWKKAGTLTKSGNPRHLSRVGYTQLSDFCMKEYTFLHL